jgi:hypothetical protein
MPPRKNGLRRSSATTFRRRLIIFRRLFRADCGASELIEAVNLELNHDGYPPAATMALKHDLDALKHEYNCTIRFNRKTSCYQLQKVGDFAILDLPNESLDALNFIDKNFPDDNVLAAFINVQKLLRQIKMLIPDEVKPRNGIPLTFRNPGKQINEVDKRTYQVIRKAIDNKQMLAFDYTSNFELHDSRRHTVAPYEVFFRDGHAYLDAVVHAVSPAGHVVANDTVEYRLDRMTRGSTRMLPTNIPPVRPPQTRYPLVYTLGPEVARRRDLAAFFNETEITYNDDGSATVAAIVSNLWTTRQILLRYGSACVVSSPPELVQMFRDTIAQMATKYSPS